MQPAAIDLRAAVSQPSQQVHHLRQILLWPLRLVAQRRGDEVQRRPWELLGTPANAGPWRRVIDEYTGTPDRFHERHYHEFVTFLPYVQQFLYGEGRGRHGDTSPSSMHVFRRDNVRAARVQPRVGGPTFMLEVVHVDLYFFEDVDIVLLNVELAVDDLSLPQTQEILYRFGRGYPSGWDAAGQPLHTMAGVDWLDADGRVLASSDAQSREAYLEFVSEHRAPRIAAHWEFMLKPLVPDHSELEGALRYRQIEYYRMPLMAYLAVDEPRALTRTDFIRLGLVTGAGDNELPFGEQHLADFEQRHCYDRFWADAGAAPRTRYMCCGHALVVIGDARAEFYRCRDRGVLAQFRHQHFMLFLVAHVQKAALLMFSDRLVDALKRLDINDPESVKQFKRAIRIVYATFLRFTHRYWFHEVSEQAQARALFHMCTAQLGLDPLYAEVKERMHDMNSYLEADSLRRQANTVVRLTVVTIFGLVGTVTTGFLGMNLLAMSESPMIQRVLLFVVVFAGTVWLTMYTIAKSKRLSDFLDVLSEEALPWRTRLGALVRVWYQPRGK
ncbi:MAG TPA: hypothetical protein VFU71_21050 [Burkholderiaceae bacterium]|nr:hypothetical protein [Burkholderiaceae bacterium]